MAVAFKSQVAVAYKSTATIEWYGDEIAEFIGKYFVNAIDFTFEISRTDFTNMANKLAQEFEAVLTEFGIVAKAIDFTEKANAVDHTVAADLIKTSQEIA